MIKFIKDRNAIDKLEEEIRLANLKIERITLDLDNTSRAHKSLLEENRKLKDDKQLEESNKHWMFFQGASEELSRFKAFLDYYQEHFGKSTPASIGIDLSYVRATITRYRDSEAFDKALQAWKEMKDLDLID